MNERQALSEQLNAQFVKWRKINARIDKVILTILLFLIIFIGSGLIDNLIFLEEGINSIKYHSFEELLAINPDTVAWLTVDNTHIDHPVVKGEDNFEYLDMGFDGKFYAGGTLFLDENNKDLEDPYCIIHGHHMAAGAMFGDLDKFLDESFFEENRTGTLLTPKYDYDLKIVAVGTFDAYDSRIYSLQEIPSEYVKEKALYCRDDILTTEHLLALSTCAGDMTDDRTVVFCSMENKRTHR